MDKTGFVRSLLKGLRTQWPAPRCELDFKTPLELMVGVILSAQSTDKRVNEVGKTLFKKYRSPRDYLKVSPPELENDVRTTGFFRAKTKSIRGACNVLIEEFGGEMPRRMEDLLKLPGIGRKSANVILGAAFGIAEGVVVDTHMIRLANRMRLASGEDPVKIETALNALVPQKERIFFSQAMVLHGRYICVARAPRCWECVLLKTCPFSDKILSPKPGEPSGPRTTITGIPIRTPK